MLTPSPPVRSDSQRSATRSAMTVAVVLAMALALFLRLVALGKGGFWLDEVFSASFANLSAVGTVLAVFLHDVHPPLYYLQLNAWGQLGHGDYWLLLNSVFWSALTLTAVYFGVRAQFGAGAARLSLAFCAVLGSEIYFAQQLRMYAMYSCLAVLSWVCAHRVLTDFRFSRAVPFILVLALVGAVHSASLIGASSALLYVLPIGAVKPSRQRMLTWCAIALVVMCAFAPWVINSSHRHVGL